MEDCTCDYKWIPKKFEITHKKDTSQDIIEYYPSGLLKSAKKYSNYEQSVCGCFYGLADYEEYYENGNLKCKGIYLWEDYKAYDWHYYFDDGHWDKTEKYYSGRDIDKNDVWFIKSTCAYVSNEKYGKMKFDYKNNKWITIYEKDIYEKEEYENFPKDEC